MTTSATASVTRARVHNKSLVSVVLPAFNEAGNLELVVRKVLSAAAAVQRSCEIVIVNDGSTDETREIADRLALNHVEVRVAHHRRNMGLTEALRTARELAAGDTIVFLPSDLQSDPEEDLPALLAKIDEGYDVVAGWREGRHDGKEIASWIYNQVSRWLFGVTAHDMNWTKAFRRDVLSDVTLRADWHRFILHMLADQGYRIGEVKTRWHPRHSGVSKFGRKRLLVSVFDVMALKFLLTFSRAPMRFFGGLGVILFLAATTLGGYLFWLWEATATQRRPLFWIMLVLFLLSGLVVLVGFLAELIVNLEDRLTRRSPFDSARS
jgi:dolichol-phosphate mannosyltransferase